MTPASPLSLRPTIIWLLFSFNGRIDREVYWLGLGLVWSLTIVGISVFLERELYWFGIGPIYNLVVAVLGAAIVLQVEDVRGPVLLGLIMAVLGGTALWAELALLAKRLHDCDRRGRWALFALLPVIGFIWIAAAGVIMGNTGSNGYAPGPNQPSGTRWPRNRQL